MTTYEYLTKEIGEKRCKELARAGIVSVQVLMYADIYRWHLANGKSRRKTASQFKMPESSVGYAIMRMKKQITIEQ